MPESESSPLHCLKRYEWFVIGLAATAELWILSVVPQVGSWSQAALVGYLALFLAAILVPIGLYYRATLRHTDDSRRYPPGD